MRVFVKYAPPYDPGINGGLLARMAAANGDRRALVRHLKELVDSGSIAFAFVRHAPMIQPYLKDPEVIARRARRPPRRMAPHPAEVLDGRCDTGSGADQGA